MSDLSYDTPVTAKEYGDGIRAQLANELTALEPGRYEPDMVYAGRLTDVARNAIAEAQTPLDRADAAYRAIDDPLLTAKTAGTELQLHDKKLTHGEPETFADTYAAAAGAATTAGTALADGAARTEQLAASVEQAAGRLLVADEAMTRLREHVQDRDLFPRLAAELRPEDQHARLLDVASSVAEARGEVMAAGAHLRNGRQDLASLSAAVDAVAPAQEDGTRQVRDAAAGGLSRAGSSLEAQAQDIRRRLGTDRDLVWQAAATAGSARTKAGELEAAFRVTADAEQVGAEISGMLTEVKELTTQGRETARSLRPDAPGYAQGLAQVDRNLALCEQKLGTAAEALGRLDRMPADEAAKTSFATRLDEQQRVVTAARGAIGQELAGAKDPEIDEARRGVNPPVGPRRTDRPAPEAGQDTEVDLRRRAPATVDTRTRPQELG